MVLERNISDYDALNGFAQNQIVRWVGQPLSPMGPEDRAYVLKKLELPSNADEMGLNEGFADFTQRTAQSLGLSDRQTGEIKQTLLDRLRQTGLITIDNPTMADILRAQFGDSPNNDTNNENTPSTN